MNTTQERPKIVLYDEETDFTTRSNHPDEESHDLESFTPLDSEASPTMLSTSHYEAPRQLHAQSVQSDSNFNTTTTRLSAGTNFSRHPQKANLLHQDEDEFGHDAKDEDGARKIPWYETNYAIVVGVILGAFLGVLLSQLKVSKDISKLVSLPGQLFLNLLKCLVLPMVFASLASGIVNLLNMGKVVAIGYRTIALFLFTTTIAALTSMTFAVIFSSLIQKKVRTASPPASVTMDVLCANDLFLEMSNRTSLMTCTGLSPSNFSRINVLDLTDAVASQTKLMKVTLSDSILNIMASMFPDNIVKSFQDGVILSIIAFALAFGAAAVQTSTETQRPLLDLLLQLNQIFYYLITKLIALSPIAVLSLTAGSLASQSSIGATLQQVGVMLLGYLIAWFTHELIFLPLLFWLVTKKNPYAYLRQMIPCIAFAFGCASSIATLPVTMRCVESTREVSRPLHRFVTTVGCTVNMNGTAMMFPAAVSFLAATSTNVDDSMGFVQMIITVIVAVLSSIGVAPIPNGGLVMVYSVWSTVFPSSNLPDSFSYLVATYWFIDRFNTTANVVGDTWCSRMIAEQVDETMNQVKEENS